MSSVAGLIVPNNFNIASSGGDIAEGLYSSNNTNVINTTASPNPVAGQVLKATGPNAATWQEESVTPSSTTTFTNKIMTDTTNFTAASSLFANAGANQVAVRNAAVPSAGQVLTATSSFGANWQSLPTEVNTIRGGFEGLGAASVGTTLETVNIGSDPGAYVIKSFTVANVNTGADAASWESGAVFRIPLGGGPIVFDSSAATIFGGTGTMLTEMPPLWVIDTATTIKLEKQGAVSSVWGGTYKIIKSGTV